MTLPRYRAITPRRNRITKTPPPILVEVLRDMDVEVAGPAVLRRRRRVSHDWYPLVDLLAQRQLHQRHRCGPDQLVLRAPEKGAGGGGGELVACFMHAHRCVFRRGCDRSPWSRSGCHRHKPTSQNLPVSFKRDEPGRGCKTGRWSCRWTPCTAARAPSSLPSATLAST